MITPTKFVSSGARIGVFFANGIGDHIMTLPALRALLKNLPSQVVLFAMPELRHVLLSELVVEKDVPIHLSMVNGRNRFDPGVGRAFHKDFDLFVSLNPWHSAEGDRLLGYLQPALSIGMHEHFDICVRSTELEHSSDRAFRVACTLEPRLRITDFSRPPSMSDRATRAARSVIEHFPGTRRVLAVHNETLAHKVWSHRSFRGVVMEFLDSHEDVVAISLDRVVEPTLRGRSHTRYFAPGGLPLDVALALVSQSHLFLGVDSCMLHMADLCRVPGVGLFGPDEWAPLGSREMGFHFAPHRHVHGHGNMDGICSDSVLTALNELALPMTGTS